MIINPYSRRNSRALHQETYGVPSAQPRTRQELFEILKEYARRDIRIVAIDGGDGTVREVLSALPDIYRAGELPDLVILPSGYTNVIAVDVGTPGPGAAGLKRLVAALAGEEPPLQPVERPVLEVRRRAGEFPVRRGFFFGAAAFAHATREFYSRRRLEPVIGAAAVSVFTGASLLRALIPGKRRSLWAKGEPMSVCIDGHDRLPAEQHFMLLATTLRRLVFRLWPFWGGEGKAMHWLDIAAPPQRLLQATGPVMRGQPMPWMQAAGYRSGTADRLDIDLKVPFVLDGELFEPGAAGITLSVGPKVRFLAP